MDTIGACRIIEAARAEAVLIATMGAMVAFDKLEARQPRLNSVPLMGGAPSLGLGLALAKAQCKVVVVDGDASLLMQLGGLVTVAGLQPLNLVHFVISNGTQFSGMSNLPVPGRQAAALAALARAAGYVRTYRFTETGPLSAAIDDILAGEGPVFVELVVQPDAPTFSAASPQQDWTDRQFTRMGDEARQLGKWLETR